MDKETTPSSNSCRTDDMKKQRYKNQYYCCYGVGCNHDYRYLPNLFEKTTKPQPIKESFKDLNLEPKFYNNTCKLCTFLKKASMDKNKAKELITQYKRTKQTDTFLKHEVIFLKSHYPTYQELIDIERQEITKLIQTNRNIEKNSNVSKLEETLAKFKEHYDNELVRLKKRIFQLEKRNPQISISKITS